MPERKAFIGGVFLIKKRLLSIMVNEEDHFRIQYLLSGLQLNNIWRFINEIDNEIEKR